MALADDSGSGPSVRLDRTRDGAHRCAGSPVSRRNLFVVIVILGGPLAGLALTWLTERAGSWVVAITMAGAFIFGVVNHFILAGTDHVGHVAAPWRPLFATTAALLALTEALGSALAIRLALLRKS